MLALGVVLALLPSACTPIMAATRSSYRGAIKVAQVGVDRAAVWHELGEPDNSNPTDDGGYEDRYTMDPEAHRGWVQPLTAAKDRLATYTLTNGPDQKRVSLEKTKP